MVGNVSSVLSADWVHELLTSLPGVAAIVSALVGAIVAFVSLRRKNTSEHSDTSTKVDGSAQMLAALLEDHRKEWTGGLEAIRTSLATMQENQGIMLGMIFDLDSRVGPKKGNIRKVSAKTEEPVPVEVGVY